MSRAKQVVCINGRYAGKYLNEGDCKRLESLLRLNEDNGFVEDLRHVIYELTPSEVDLIKTSKSNEFVELRKGTLENLQTIGVAYMFFAKRLLLGDSVGMGKTVEVSGLCNLLEANYRKENKEFRFLYLADKTSLEKTRNKLIKFTGNYVEVLYGEKPKIMKFSDAYKYDMPYSVVGAHSLLNNAQFHDFLRNFIEDNGYFPFDLLVVDESGDVLTNTGTQTYKGGQFIASYFDRVILLNATPFEKELRQFYAQLNFLDDTLLPTKTQFSQEYEVMSYGIRSYPVFSGKYKNAEKFMDLIRYRYLKRTRKETGAVMIDCSAEILVSTLSKEQKKLLNTVSMPAMVYDCPSYFKFSDVETNTETTPKLRDTVELVTNRFKDEKSILIYTRYKESQVHIARELSERGILNDVLNGETSSKERNAIIDKFKLGDIRVLITNVQKSLDFGNCNVCIFYDYDPNPSNMVQFEGRMTREYNIIGKRVVLLISKGNELKTFKKVVSDRAKAGDLFTGSDFSCVLQLLLDSKELREEK